MQDRVYEYICNRADFMRTTDIQSTTVNIIFMVYTFQDDPDNKGHRQLVLSSVEGTSHANLQQAILYKEAPLRDAFCQSIKASLDRTLSIAPTTG